MDPKEARWIRIEGAFLAAAMVFVAGLRVLNWLG